MFILIRSIIFHLGLIVLTVVFGTIGFATVFIPYSSRYHFFSGWAAAILMLLRWICALDYRVRGLENIQPNQTYVLYVKHQSLWETISATVILPMHISVVKQEVMRIPFFGRSLRLLNCIAIDRDEGRASLKKLMQEGTAALKSKRHVLIYPEGTRVPVGEVREFQVGGAMLAKKAGAPIIPIAHNAGKFWKKSGFLIRPGTIEVRIGRAIDTKQHSARQANLLAKQWIDNTMLDMQ